MYLINSGLCHELNICFIMRICEISVSQQVVPRASVSSPGSPWTGLLQYINIYHMAA